MIQNRFDVYLNVMSGMQGPSNMGGTIEAPLGRGSQEGLPVSSVSATLKDKSTVMSAARAHRRL